MKKTLTANVYLPILLIAVLGFLVIPNIAFAGIGQFFYEYIVIGFFGWILGLTGVVLNYSINHFVIGFGEFFDTGFGNTVNTVWATIRDLFNLTFIFGLVYIGFKMILRSDDSNTRRWLISLILAALLVNFSLFITKFVIDFSNILAVEIINTAIDDNSCAGPCFATDPFTINAQNLNGVNVSQSLQQATNIVTTASEIQALGGNDAVNAQALDSTGSFSVIFGTMIVFLVASFVYLSAAVLIIIRGVVLIVLMILSPFLFIGMVLPMFKSTQSQMWSTLFKRAFFAPIYIMFLYITIKLAGAFTMGSFIQAMAPGTAGSASTAAAFGPFIVIIVLLLLSMMAAQKLGAEGASVAVGIGNSIKKRGQKAMKSSAVASARFARKTGGAAVVGGGAAVGRRTLGRLAYNSANSEKLKLAAAGGGIAGTYAKAKLAGAKKVSEASFDPRAKKDSWNRNTGGYAQTAKDNEKKEKEKAKALEREPFDKDGKPKADFEEARQKDEAYTTADRAVRIREAQKGEAEEYLNLSKKSLINGDSDLNDLKAQLKTATSDSEKEEIDRKIFDREQELESEFTSTNAGMIKELSKISGALSTAKKSREQASARLEGEYKYAHVNTLKETRAEQNAFWKNQDSWGKTGASALAGAGTGAAVGAMAGPIGAAVGAAVGAIVGSVTKSAVVNSKRDHAEARVATITKEYGVDADSGVVGGKKIKNQEEDSLLKKLKEKLKEDEDSGGESTKTETV